MKKRNRNFEEDRKRSEELIRIINNSELHLAKMFFPNCVKVKKPSVEMDKKGVDAIYILNTKEEIFIDYKSREKGCSQYWNKISKEAQVAPELWSDIERKKIGWTLDQEKITDYIVHLYYPEDYHEPFMFDFPLYRKIFIRYHRHWKGKYRTEIQNNKNWQSECVFIPRSIIEEAIEEERKSLNIKNGDI